MSMHTSRTLSTIQALLGLADSDGWMQTGRWPGPVLSWAVLAMTVALPDRLPAANFTYSLTMPPGTSYTNAVWQPGNVAPTPGNTYEVVSGGTVLAPWSAGVVTFGGDSLILDSGATLRAGTNTVTMDLRFPGTGTSAGLILAGGSIALTSSNVTLSGTLLVDAASTINLNSAVLRGLTLASRISGAGNLKLLGGGANNLPFELTALSNSFTGAWLADRYATLKASGVGSLGRASIYATNQYARVEPMYDVATPGFLRISSNALFVLHQNCVFGSVIVTNFSLPIGTFSYAYLSNTFRTNFTGTAGQIVVLPAPTGLAATAGNAQVALSWSSVTASNTYKVYRALAFDGPFTLLSSPSGPSYTDSTAANGTTYYYAVTAVSPTGGESGYLDPVTATPAAPPPGPTDLAAAAGNTTVTLTWSGAAGAAEYQIKRSLTSGSGYVSIATNIGNANVTYLDTGLANGMTYYYVVTAVSAGGESDPSNETVGQPSPAPTDLVAVAGFGQVGLTWSDFVGALSYSVKRASTSRGPYTAIASGLVTTTYTDTPLAAGSIYYYVVSALLPGEVESGNSTEAVAVTGPTTPSDLSASAQNYTNILLTWASANNPALTTIKIERSVDGITFSQIDAVPATGTSYVSMNLTLASSYYYRIRASNITGDSPYSSVASATTPGLTLTVNFANGVAGHPVNDPAPTFAGYLVDIGQGFTVRTNGSQYGWDLDNTTNAIWRKTATAPDLRYATLQIMKGTNMIPRKWEIAVPNGSYQVHIVGGDPGPAAVSPMIEQFTVEGTVTPAVPVNSAAPWAEFTNVVQVADGTPDHHQRPGRGQQHH